MDFKDLQKAVANLNWNMNFHTFCREILEKDNLTNEQLEKDAYCLEKWQKWQGFNKALHLFDDETLERIVAVYERNKA
jgi:hypothetical protein